MRAVALLLLLALAAPASGQELDPRDPTSWARLAAAWIDAPEEPQAGLRRLAWEVAAIDSTTADAFERGVGRVAGLEGLSRLAPAEAPPVPELAGRTRALERRLETLVEEGAPRRPCGPERCLERLLQAVEAAGEPVQVGLHEGPSWLEPLMLVALGSRSEEVLLAARDRAADAVVDRWLAGGDILDARIAFGRLRSDEAPRPLAPLTTPLDLERADAAGWRPPPCEEWDALGLGERLDLLGQAVRIGVGTLPCPRGAAGRPTVEGQLRSMGWLAVPLLVELASGHGARAAATGRELLRPYCAGEPPAEWWERWRARGPRAWWRAEAIEERNPFRRGDEEADRQLLERLLALAVTDLREGAAAALLVRLSRLGQTGVRQLVDAVAALDLPELTPILEASLDSKDPVVVRTAARALATRGSTRAAEGLLPLALSDAGEGALPRSLETLTTLLRLERPEAAELALHVARAGHVEGELVRRLVRHRGRRDVRLVLLAIGAEALDGEARPVAEVALAAATLRPPALRPGDPTTGLASALAAEVAPDLSPAEQAPLRRAALLLGSDAQAPLLAAGYDVRAALARDLVALAPHAGHDAEGVGCWARPWVEAALRDGVAPVESGLALSLVTCDAELPARHAQRLRAQAGQTGVPGLLRLVADLCADPGPVAGLELILSRDGTSLALHGAPLGLPGTGPAVEVELAGPGCDHSLHRRSGGSPVDAARELLPAALVELLAARGPEARVHLRVWR